MTPSPRRCLMLLVCGALAVGHAARAAWTRLDSGSFNCVATSLTGKQIIIGDGNYPYGTPLSVTHDGQGVSAYANETNAQGVACSWSGQRCVAVCGGTNTGPIYVTSLYSTNTFPTPYLAWHATSAPITNWHAVACSADGMKIIAGGDGPSVFISTNGGGSWAPNPVSQGLYSKIYSVASSTNGDVLVIASSTPGTVNRYSGCVVISTNGGLTWDRELQRTSFGAACSGDGRIIVSGGVGNPEMPEPLYISTDGGLTWHTNMASTGMWHAVACSPDGRKLAAAVVLTYPYDQGFSYGISTNSGASWFFDYGSNYTTSWNAMAFTPDGTKLVVAGNSLAIWDSGEPSAPATPDLRITVSNDSSIVISWPVDSEYNVLSSLTGSKTNWQDQQFWSDVPIFSSKPKLRADSSNYIAVFPKAYYQSVSNALFRLH